MQQYDTIIIGAGHNGLVCATYLAQQGQRVLVLEALDTPGGLAATREFFPGFKASVAHTVSHFSAKVARDLKLAVHGFDSATAPMPTVGLNSAGEHIVLSGTGAEAEINGVSAEDATSYRGYRQLLQRFAELLEPFWLKTMPRVGDTRLSSLLTFAQLGLKLRLLGKQDMGEFMRVATLPARDLMDENFDSELLKAMLSWDGLIGSKMAPRSPNATVLALLYRMSGELGGAHAIPVGGIESLIGALNSAAASTGVEVKTGARVGRILIEGSEDGLRATGVELANGEQIVAGRVVSSADPQRTFLQLLGVEYLEIEFSNRIRRLRCEGYVAKLHLALDGVPNFEGLAKPDGRMIIAADMDAIEFAYDDAKYGNYSQQLVMEIVVPSLHQESLAPAGKHVLSAHIMYVPHKLKGGWTEEARALLVQRAIDTVAIYAPAIRAQILHSELLTPLDLEQIHNVTGGHWHHTEFSADQLLMMRPTYEAAQYSTPIPGLYLCGAGSHPGGGLMGGPGHNAARQILG